MPIHVYTYTFCKGPSIFSAFKCMHIHRHTWNNFTLWDREEGVNKKSILLVVQITSTSFMQLFRQKIGTNKWSLGYYFVGQYNKLLKQSWLWLGFYPFFVDKVAIYYTKINFFKSVQSHFTHSLLTYSLYTLAKMMKITDGP